MLENDGKVYEVKKVDHKKGQVTHAIFGQQDNLADNGKDAKTKHMHLWHMFKLNESLVNAVKEYTLTTHDYIYYNFLLCLHCVFKIG